MLPYRIRISSLLTLLTFFLLFNIYYIFIHNGTLEYMDTVLFIIIVDSSELHQGNSVVLERVLLVLSSEFLMLRFVYEGKYTRPNITLGSTAQVLVPLTSVFNWLPSSQFVNSE